MKNKMIFLVILLVVAIVTVAVALFLAFGDIKDRNVLTAQINAIGQDGEIDMNIASTGEYAVIEKQVKEDCQTYYDAIDKLKENFETISKIDVINLENYKNDGPEFNESLGKLNSLKEENEQLIQALDDLTNDIKLNQKADGLGLSSRNRKLYMSIIEILNLKANTETEKSENEKFESYLDSLIDILSYLKDNGNQWFIENDALKSQSQEFIDTYNKKVEEMKSKI